MTDPLLTATAGRYVARLLSAIAPCADRLDTRFAALLRRRGLVGAQMPALLAITPAAASRLKSTRKFREQVEYHGRRLAKLNVPMEQAIELLKAFGGLLDAALKGQFEPAREKLFLSTVLMLQGAYYRVRESEAQALYDLYRAEAEASDLDDLLGRFGQVLTGAFHAHAGRLLLLEAPPAGELAHPCYIEGGDAREALIADSRLRGRYRCYWSFPVSPVAVLQFGFASLCPWLPREAALLRAAGERCREAIEKARMQSEIRRLEAEARRAEEDERRRIGRELHDEAVQSLALLRLQLELLQRDADERMRPTLAEACETAGRTADELRRVVAALSPAVLERLGLRASLQQLTARFQKQHSAAMRVRISGDSEGLSRQYQEVIYRVAQESLQNIAKHSQANRVNLLLRTTDKNVRLIVSDNGAGFLQEPANIKPMSFGLTGMRERAALLRGNLTVRSAPGKGVRVLLELPGNATTVGKHG